MQHSHVHLALKGQAHTAGNGALLFVRKSLSGRCKLLGFHPEIPLAWVQVSNTFIGFLYVKPESTRTSQQQEDFLATLHASVSHHALNGDVILMGDFNAKLGKCADCSTTHRASTDEHNPMGRLLMHWCEHNGFMTLTGRMDAGQPSRFPIGNQPGQPSRIDHAFVQPHLLPRVLAWNLHTETYGSDHLPLCMTLTVPQHSQALLHVGGIGRRLVWDYDKQPAYSNHVHTHQALRSLTELLQACQHSQQLDQCDILLKQVIWDAAASAGLTKQPSTTRPKRPPLHLTDAAIRVKHRIQLLHQAKQPIPMDLRKEWRKHIKEARKRRANRLHAKLREWLHSHPRIFWSFYKVPADSTSAVMSTEAWCQHFRDYFHKSTLPTPIQHHQPADIDPSCPLTQPVSVEEVAAACKKVGTAKAVGVDGIPSEFITHTCLDNRHASTLHTALASLFTSITQLGHMPTSWKPKVISPIFKKGSRTEPTNYRPITVATSIYRVFATVFATRLTEFVANNPNHLSPSQFAFQQQLSTNHAHLILQTCCDAALHNRQRLAIVRLDISKAYDTVLRDKLWQVLEAQGIPAPFIQLMQEVYRDCPHHVKVNGELSAAFHTNIGVLQGCPLSPWAYNEYIADALKQIQTSCAEQGIQLYDLQMSPCTHVGWADDIIGTVQQDAVAAFVTTVQQVLDPLNQRLSVGKTRVLLIQHRPHTAPTFAGYEAVQAMKILGLLYNHKGCMANNVITRRDTAHTKAIMHSGRLKALGCMYDMSISRTMLETDVRSTLLFGGPIWGHYHISGTDPMKHPMQKPYSTIARQALGLPHGTAHWSVALLFGLMPIQHWIVRDFCRFWNNLLGMLQHNALLRWSIQQQAHMMRHNRKCWLGRWRHVLQKLIPAQLFDNHLSNLSPIHEKLVVTELELKYHEVLMSKGDPHTHPCPNRRTAFTYHTIQPQLRLHRKPACMHVYAPQHVKHTWFAFLAAACTIVPVNDYNRLQVRPHPNAPPVRVPYQNITCTKCTGHVIADEAHVLLHCPVTEPCRQTFQASHTLGSTLRAFVTTHCSNPHAAFFVHQCMRVYASAPDVAQTPIAPGTPHQPQAHNELQMQAPSIANQTSTSATTVTARLGSLSSSDYDSTSDIESEDPLTHIPRRTENQSLLRRAQMIARARLRRIED
jgi:exonuclease III